LPNPGKHQESGWIKITPRDRTRNDIYPMYILHRPIKSDIRNVNCLSFRNRCSNREKESKTLYFWLPFSRLVQMSN
jgi:hypothetical protein